MDATSMLKNALLGTLLLISGFLLAHNGENPIEKSLNITRQSKKPVIIQDLIIPINSFNQPVPAELKHTSYFNLNQFVLNNIILSKPDYLITEFRDPYGVTLQLELERQEVYEAGAMLTTNEDPIGIPMTGGAYYRGIIRGEKSSFVALSFIAGEIVGVMATQDQGNIIIGKPKQAAGFSESQTPHMIYYENDLKVNSNFTCAVPELPQPQQIAERHEQTEAAILPNGCKKVRVYLECDYQMYKDKSNSKLQVENYITAVFNVVKTLYLNEDIKMEISQINVWTTQDPYLHTGLVNIIFDYAARRNSNFNGDLAQLVTTYAPQQQGGIAFLDGMCRAYNDGSSRSPHSFAFIYNTYSSFPQYSWTVEVMAHEMGHNFGSEHTHNCVWGPNKNVSIDNCIGPDNGVPCSQGPRPTGGGTIMSYCHLVSGVGINFTKGFGPEPGDVLRAAVQNKTCLSKSITPTQNASITGPYYSGDTIKLRANPYLNSYVYDWFHYDVLLKGKNDTVLKVAESGEYKVAISSDCTEFSSPIDIVINPVAVNLGCVPIVGKTDSLSFSKNMNVDDNLFTDSLIIPASAYQNIPANVKNIIVELYMTITPVSANTVNKTVITTFVGPNKIVENLKYTPNDTDPDTYRAPKTYYRKLGVFDPKGTWIFSTKDSKPDLGVDARITWRVVLKWKADDVIPSCSIPICGTSNRILDAGIVAATYLWSNGATTKTITVNSPGVYSVTVTKNNQTSSHSVTLFAKNQQFSQQISICQGDTLRIQNSKYFSSGVYTNMLKASDGCDSILQTTLTVNPVNLTNLTKTLCYNDLFNGLKMTRDTTITDRLIGYLNCDSIVTTQIKVQPEISIKGIVAINCENVGAGISTEVAGGLSPYNYQWSNGMALTTLSGLKDGKYILKITDGNGCTSEKEFIVDNYDSVGINAIIKNVNCFGESSASIEAVVSSGTQPINFSWSTGSTMQRLVDIKKGRYNLYASDINGCTFSRDYDVTEPDLLISIMDTKASNGSASDGSVTPAVYGGTKPYKFKWSNGDTTAVLNNVSAGNYAVTITDALGCVTQNSTQVISGLNSIEESKIVLIPNPVKDRINISSADKLIEQYSIIAVTGQVIAKSEPKLNKQNLSISSNGFSTGHYIVKLTMSDGKQIVKHFFKE